MRGKRASRYCAADSTRITPADAGKTLIDEAKQENAEDHPRGCGENEGTDIPLIETLRITPADAGKTDTLHAVGHGLEDHPRGCGENVLYRLLCAFFQGSPPRMRGKHPCRQSKLVLPGITPADAGKTSTRNFFNASSWDHPRGCGENAGTEHYYRHRPGSPPRMRGKRQRRCSMSIATRITPADAGKTQCLCVAPSQP